MVSADGFHVFRLFCLISWGVKSGFSSSCEVGQVSERLLDLVLSLKKVGRSLACQNPDYRELTLYLDHHLIPGSIFHCLESRSGWLLDSVS